MAANSNLTFRLVAFQVICASLYGQAPAKGSGSVTPNGQIRVIDGDTLDVVINGRRVAVGLIGVDAPEGNTPCGKQAVQAMGILIHSGLRLDEDTGFTFDIRTRRMYYARSQKDGHSLAVDMVNADMRRLPASPSCCRSFSEAKTAS